LNSSPLPRQRHGELLTPGFPSAAATIAMSPNMGSKADPHVLILWEGTRFNVFTTRRLQKRHFLLLSFSFSARQTNGGYGTIKRDLVVPALSIGANL
jgi:hypothetical protein